MEKRRTVPVKLKVPQDREDDLLETIEQFKQAANHVSATAWNREGYKETSKTTLHAETYKEVRESTDLPANLVQAARNVAAEAVKSGVARLKKGEKTSRPIFTADVARYDKRVLTDFQNYCTLATVNERVKAQYVLPENTDTPHHKYLLNDEYEFRTATLHYRNNEFYLHVTLLKTVEEPEKPENETVLGIDLGIKNLAVTSTGTFFSGGELTHWRKEFQKTRKGLQQTGTQSAHRTIVDMDRSERERVKHLLHQVSKTIVENAENHDCSVIAFEDLTDIRKRLPGASKFHTWSFRELHRQVKYKAEAKNIQTEQVNPKNTSRRCSKCGFTHPKNRNKQHFKCLKCGYQLDSDYNAAKNIGTKRVRSRQKSEDRTGHSQLALKSGTMTGNGTYTPTATVAV